MRRLKEEFPSSERRICELMEIPIPERHLTSLYSQFHYSDKPIRGSVRSLAAANDTVEMSKIVFGRNFLETHNCLYAGSTPTRLWSST